VFVQQGAVKTLDDAVALRPADLSGSVLNVFQLEEEFEGMLVRTSAELPAVVAEDGLDPRSVIFEERQDAFIEDMDRGDGNLGVVEVTPGVP